MVIDLARVIAVASGKGGVGKTTVALNLGTVLAQQFNRSVTLIDCNVTTSHLGMYLGIYYSPVTLNKVLRGEVQMNEAVHDHLGGMKVIPASLSLSDLEGVDMIKLREKINMIADENEIILLDAAPGLGREAISTLKAADEVLFVTTPYVPAVMDVVRTMEVVNELGVKPIGIVLNMTHKERYEMTPQEVEQLTRVPVIASIPFDKNVNKSVVEKLPITTFKPDSKATRAMVMLGAKVINEPYEERRGVFGRIMRRLGRRVRRARMPETPSALLGSDLQAQALLSQPGSPESVFPQEKPSTPGVRPPKPDE